MNWKQYSALAASMLALSNKSSAQIIYTDIPDTLFTWLDDPFTIDLNNDGIVDLKLKISVGSFFSSSSGGWCTDTWHESLFAEPYEGNAIINNPLSLSDPIGTNSLWNPNSAFLAKSSIWNIGFGELCSLVTQWESYSGNWSGVNNQYLGVRFSNGSDTLFGWVRLSVSTGVATIIKDYAYNLAPGAPINAGDLGCANFTHSLPVGPVNFCLGGSLAITGPYGEYKWYKNNIVIPGETSSTLNINYSGNYFAVVSSPGGCIDTTNATQVNLYMGPVTITRIGDTLVASSGIAYQWLKGNAPISGGTDQYFYPQVEDYYKVKVTEFLGCTFTSNEYHYTRCDWINNLVIPSINGTDYLSTFSFAVCSWGINGLKLSASQIPGYGYQWIRNDSLINGATFNTYTPFADGNYYCQIGKYDVLCPSLTISATYLDKPLITQIGDVLFSSSLDYNQWLLNGNIIPGAVEQSYQPAEPGSYSVRLIGTDGCEVESDPFMFTGVQLLDLFDDYPNIRVFPQKLIEIELNSQYYLGGKISIINQLGQSIGIKELNSTLIRWSMQEISAGWYCVLIEKDRKRFYKPIFLY